MNATFAVSLEMTSLVNAFSECHVSYLLKATARSSSLTLCEPLLLSPFKHGKLWSRWYEIYRDCSRYLPPFVLFQASLIMIATKLCLGQPVLFYEGLGALIGELVFALRYRWRSPLTH